jgi:hypothetical protein
MSNPLTDRAASTEFTRILLPGDERMVTTKDGKVVSIIRTGRPYAYDLADAYNAASTRPELEWRVDGAGNVRLDHRPDWSRQNSVRQEQRRTTESARALQRSFEDARG